MQCIFSIYIKLNYFAVLCVFILDRKIADVYKYYVKFTADVYKFYV